MIERNCFISKESLDEHAGTNTNFLLYQGLINIISKYIEKFEDMPPFDNKTQGPILPTYIKKIVTSPKEEKHIYKILIQNSDIPACQTKWNSEFCNIDWKNVHELVFNLTKDTYIRWFQCRIVHRILGTKSLMLKMKIVANNLCTFCNNEVENIMHLFWYCPYSQEIVKFVVETIHRRRPSITIQITCQDLILGITTTKMNDLNIVCLKIKRYIFNCQKKKRIPSPFGLVNSMKHNFKIYKTTINIDDELRDWSLIQIFVDISHNDITYRNT